MTLISLTVRNLEMTESSILSLTFSFQCIRTHPLGRLSNSFLGMSLLLRLLAVFFACLPQLIAQPTNRLNLHRRHRHHKRAHHHVTNADEISTQLPMADPKPVVSKPSFIQVDTLVSLYFSSVPQWPKSGEQADFLTVPLDTWIESGN